MQETRTYQERSRASLVKAREELEAGDFEQASEKAWGAAALMVKAVAQQRGRPRREAKPRVSSLPCSAHGACEAATPTMP